MLTLESLISYLPFAAVFAALVVAGCAVWVAASLRSASAQSVEAFDKAIAANRPVDDSLKRTAAALDQLREVAVARKDSARRSAGAERAAFTFAAVPEPSPTPRSSATELSPLERETQDWAAWLASLEQQLDRWAELAAAPPGFMNDLRQGLHRTRLALGKVTNEPQMEAMRRAIKSLEEETMQTLISKTDRDLDPRGSDQRMRSLVLKIVTGVGLELIDPAEGTQPDPRLHRGVGVVAAPNLSARGTVAGVRTRGLRNSDGDVLSLAEIIEFD